MISENIRRDGDTLCKAFNEASPFRHLVLDEFFEPEVALRLREEFPSFESAEGLLTEHGGRAVKGAKSNVREFGPTFAALEEYLASRTFLETIERITGIQGLIFDPFWEGAGIHENFPGRRSHLHYDFNYHRRKGWHRRLNLIVYIEPSWQEAWGGSINLYRDGWSPETSEKVKIPCMFNRCALFETTEKSWHAVETIALPQGMSPTTRKSVTIYLYSEERPADEVEVPHQTVYVPGEQPPALKERRLSLTDDDHKEIQDYLAASKALMKGLYGAELKWSRQNQNLKSLINLYEGRYSPKTLGFAFCTKTVGVHPRTERLSRRSSFEFKCVKNVRLLRFRMFSQGEQNQRFAISVDGAPAATCDVNAGEHAVAELVVDRGAGSILTIEFEARGGDAEQAPGAAEPGLPVRIRLIEAE